MNMYFLNNQERRLLLKGYLPKSRKAYIDGDLRGWNWDRPPLEPIYELKIPLYEIANKYCKTCRDVYLRRIAKIKSKRNKAMIEGTILHETIVNFIIKAKKLIYQEGPKNIDKVLSQLEVIDFKAVEKHKDILNEEETDIKNKVKILWNYEYNSAVSRIQNVLSRQPYINEDSLVSQAFPVVVEQKLNGSFLGLSPYLSADAFTMTEPMIVDLKFGDKKDFHKLSTTGYALVMESLFEFPVNIGCIVYGKIKDDRIIIEKEFHIIDDEMREWFIDERNERMYMLFEEIDPGMPEECYETCSYYKDCN